MFKLRKNLVRVYLGVTCPMVHLFLPRERLLRPPRQAPRAAMERIEGVTVGRCAASPYMQPFTVHCRQNGAQKPWDFMKTHDSVTILLFNSSGGAWCW